MLCLVSYAYNPGDGWAKTTKRVNDGKHHEAMIVIKRRVFSKGEKVRSLVVRRDAEASIFLYREYQ
ncbi:hypothetical protein C8J43_103561 [Sphingomonas sp. PP-CE-1G-424]|nr:hypothetical protein C8J43_103561 [Sphingomonas sp. PP-CE-1G-424]